MNIYLTIFIGGGLGSLSRYALSRIVTSNFQNINPVATLIANIFATLILGVFVYILSQKTAMPAWAKPLIVTGFCGGFSTFSTFSFETYELMKQGYFLIAGANVLVSVALGLLVLFAMQRF